MIPVSKPWLPNLEELTDKLIEPWQTGILTHNGPLVREFESRLEELWDVKNVIAVSNGTMAIQLAIRALGLSGEIITSPFTWHATATAIKWEGCKVVFADIDETSLCLDPGKVQSRISEKTVGIMPINVYGNPPDFRTFNQISEETGIPIIYDAAHAAFTKLGEKSSLSFGAISTTSFHATKLIHTGEGGACITQDDKIADLLRSLRFFGFQEEGDMLDYGTNAKMTEVNAAIGLCCLDNLEKILSKRKSLAKYYQTSLSECPEITIIKSPNQKFEGNNLYFPVEFQNEEVLDRVIESLTAEKIYPRRYFYPSLNLLSNFDKSYCPISEDASKRILCLPLHTHMREEDIEKIASLIVRSLNDDN